MARRVRMVFTVQTMKQETELKKWLWVSYQDFVSKVMRGKIETPLSKVLGKIQFLAEDKRKRVVADDQIEWMQKKMDEIVRLVRSLS